MRTSEQQEQDEANKQAELAAAREEHNRRVAKGGAELPEVGSNYGPKD